MAVVFATEPSQLDVLLGAKNMRFSLIAEFDDGTLGDITNWAPFGNPEAGREIFVQTNTAPKRPILKWGTDHPGEMDVDEQTGVLNCQSVMVAGAQITATLDPEPALGLPAQRSQAGLADSIASWATPTPLTFIDGPGFAKMGDNDIRNFLILPAGFANTPADKNAFDRLARDLVKKLHKQTLIHPWDLLITR